MNDLRFDVINWVDLASTNQDEQATACELRILTGDESLFVLEDSRSRSTRAYVRVSAYPLASWLVENYFRIRHEVRMNSPLDYALAHDFSSIGAGYIWPRIELNSDGQQILVRVKSSTKDDVSPVFIRANTEPFWISHETFDLAVSSLIRTINARLADRGIHTHYVKELWEAVAHEKDSPLRRLEAQLGLPPWTRYPLSIPSMKHTV